MDERLEARESRGLAALRLRTLARSEGVRDSASFTARNVDAASARMAVFRFEAAFVTGAGARRSSTGTSSSGNGGSGQQVEDAHRLERTITNLLQCPVFQGLKSIRHTCIKPALP